MSDVKSMEIECPSFVFVRFWPGFGDSFPFGTFEDLPDEQIAPAVEKFLLREIPNTLDYQTKKAAWKTEKVEKIRAFRRSLTIAPGGVRAGKPRRQRPPEDPFADTPDLILRLMNWHGFGNTHIHQPLVSRRCWLAELPGESAARELTRLLARRIEHWKVSDEWPLAHFGPRFGHMTSHMLDHAQVTVIRTEIDLLCEGQLFARHEQVAKLFLDRLGPAIVRFVEAWYESSSGSTKPIGGGAFDGSSRMTEDSPRSPSQGKRKLKAQSSRDDDPKTLWSALATWHQFGADGESFIPATQKNLLDDLNLRTIGWDKSRLSKAFGRLFSSGMKTYKQLCAGSTPLSGWTEKLADESIKIEVAEFRPAHPTEREQRRSSRD